MENEKKRKEIFPKDIEHKINQIFLNSEENQEVKQLIFGLWSTVLNVGADQLARSILTLSEGSIDELRNIFQRNFYDDPRDVIMLAESKVGSPKHYFIPTFDEIETKNDKK